MKKKYQLDWLPFWSSQVLGPRNPIWEGRREEQEKEEGKRELRLEKGERKGKSQLPLSVKCVTGGLKWMHFNKRVQLSAHLCYF